MQQIFLGMGAVATKTYIDDVFSTNVYTGTSSSTGSGTTQAINTGFDLASEGGLVWNKGRSFSDNHFLIDTVRGANKLLKSNQTASESTYSLINAFTSTGYTTTDDVGINGTGKTYASWTFRKAPGFFDVVTYNGSSSAQNISHSLGCVPGMIMVKKTSGSDAWAVYHRSTTYNQWLRLNTTNASENNDVWNNTAPTASVFSVGANGVVNESGATYVAYVFAGGESTAATARSVDFDGTGDYLSLAASSDFAFGTGDFTVECWVKPNTITQSGVFQISADTGGLSTGGIAAALGGDSRWKLGYGNLTQLSGGSAAKGQWHHLAYVRHSGVSKLYINGIEEISVNDTTNYTYQNLAIGGYYSSSYLIDAEISNFRVVKGTAVYTSSFRPTYEPLTNITNTKLLCCNNSSTTGSTVTPGTITANGNPTASTDSPFDDPAGFVFGDAGDQNVIKCGSYVGNGSSTGPEINLGWEPQWVLIKNTSTAKEWKMLDSMRGLPTGSDDNVLIANSNEAETGSLDNVDLTSTGFKLTSNNSHYNTSGDNYIFMCIRRSDGYCGKPPELGTGVFGMAYGTGTDPAFAPGFPVDFTLFRRPGTVENWTTSARLIQGKYLHLNQAIAENNDSNIVFDYNNGFHDASGYSTYLSWSWKRHAGFDVVNYVGNQTSGHQIAHSCGQTPEMIWTKNRDQTQSWSVGHKDLNGGTNPWGYYLALNDSPNEQENSASNVWEAPTATHFTVGSDARVNKNNHSYLAILFSSVDKISKVGSYTGSSSALTITTGFQPRFVIIKNASSTSYDSSTDWFVFDTTRGWASGNNDKLLRLNEDDAQTTEDWTNPTSTGFTINADSGNHLNNNGDRYIYYAHA